MLIDWKARGLVVLAGVEDLVDGQCKGIIEHPRQQFLQQRGGLLQARIGIDLDEPGTATLIQHEVVPHHLKTIASLLLIQLLPHAHHRQPDYLPDPPHQPLQALPSLVQQASQALKAKLIARLVLPVVFIALLHGVVGEMDIEVGDLLAAEGVRIGRGSKISLSEEIDLVIVADQDPHPYVEFAVVDEQRTFHVFLDDEGVGADCQ